VNGIDPVIERAIGGIKRTVKNLYWRTYGLLLAHPPVPSSPKSLLFVCKGNICRSPIAEAMARGHIPDGVRITCRSAGIVVGEPQGCPQETLVAAKKFGIDLSGHRSRRIDQGLVAGADMIFSMEAWQFTRLRKLFPQHKERIFLLSLFEENPPKRSETFSILNIRDPYGRDIGDFIECFERIDACLQGLFSVIRDAGNRSTGEIAGTASETLKR
jgi:protein-tyrosine phosphatase